MRETVVLFGASGTMGQAAFKQLWQRRDRYDIVLLVRPFARNKKLFRPYERQAGATPVAGRGVSQGQGFKIVWGDAINYEDVELAIRGADWVLDAMALISPQADYEPDQARLVNTEAIQNIVRAIEAQPAGAGHIRLIYTGTVAETGDRRGCLHMGRAGDPLNPSAFDFYAVTKIAGERAILESNIRHWASLRLTFIMPTDYREYISLEDPIMFHMPLVTYTEAVSDRDAGLGLVNCLDVPDDSDFWRRVYNMAGGPSMRVNAYDYLNRSFRLMGMAGAAACTERRWFALRNFHLQYYEDSGVLNDYLHFWRDSFEDYWRILADSMPGYLKLVVFLSRRVPAFRKMVERTAYNLFKKMAEEHRNGTAYWYRQRNDLRIRAFFGSYAAYEAIPAWGEEKVELEPPPACRRLSHGYDEGKPRLDLEDLAAAARFRGGECLAAAWDGDMFAPLPWKCAAGHAFTAKPNTILKTGHWCPECAPPPWDFDAEARRNPFFAQVWYEHHAEGEESFYPADCVKDIAGADKEAHK